MKYVIILLLSTSGLEQIKYPLKKNFLEKYPKEYSVLACGDQADEWRLNNTTYYDHKNNVVSPLLPPCQKSPLQFY